MMLLFLLGALLPVQAESSETNRAKMSISGFGFIGNLELKKQLRLMQKDRQAPVLYRASQIEDAVLILLAKLKEEGYLEPRVIAEVTLTNDVVRPFEWDKEFATFLPPDLRAKKVALWARKGVRFYYEQLEITGLTVIPLKQAEAYFIASEALLHIKSMRVFTPDRLQASASRLRATLNRQGYADATVEPQYISNPTNGAVRVTVKVIEGRPTWVRSAVIQKIDPAGGTNTVATQTFAQVPWSRIWEEDFAQQLRTNEYRRGFPDATVALTVRRRETNATAIFADLQALVIPGTNITLRAIRYVGHPRTRESVLRRRTQFATNAPLNRIELEQGRERLTRLGLFAAVGLRYDPVDAGTRDAIYELREGKFFESRLLVSYGSYDRLGGGMELGHRNVFGLGHQAKLRAAQTFKSTLVDARYTMPELFRQKADVFFTGSLLLREEISFDRKEYGGGLGLRRYWPGLRTDTSVRYDYQFLNAQSGGLAVGQKTRFEETQAAAIVFEFRHDRRDNPLHPRRGYKLFGNLEFAADQLGGKVSYQRFVFGGSKHWNLGGGRFVHLGGTHGLTFVWGGTAGELPFNKRFFPGGDNSVRGYQQGEAAPRNAVGEIVGAESFLQGNVEFEQFLTRSISVVTFFDAVGFAEDRKHYPFDTGLYSAGAGLRWNTVIGPVRLEYGHNLNPRRHDPSGTLHFSFGFPF